MSISVGSIHATLNLNSGAFIAGIRNAQRELRVFVSSTARATRSFAGLNAVIGTLTLAAVSLRRKLADRLKLACAQWWPPSCANRCGPAASLTGINDAERVMDGDNRPLASNSVRNQEEEQRAREPCLRQTNIPAKDSTKYLKRSSLVLG
ncbi:hypothetical protein FBZ83_11961 [Azospirillum brasilense]|uniref:Uncharacterized protein n=1 Tax=Azospirillum brasilense TaxID=192 RepID=A0A560BUW0_AZOBR|nr:hypothetical protein [Azospirillum brasilense]TWA76410.1 hypothetical protein FBZ83_11961 [Azospirillum brasilense]